MSVEGRVHYIQAAKILGVCKRRLLTEFIRLEILPRPDGGLSWSRAEVELARAWLYSDSRGAPPAR